MAISKWVYEKATSRFLYGGYYEPTFDKATQAVAQFIDRHPDPVFERFDAVLGSRPATSDELTTTTLAAADARALLGGTSRELLATLAAIDEKFNPAWGAMTNAQRKTDVLAFGERWSFWRQFWERNV